jgi:hypothetical protein
VTKALELRPEEAPVPADSVSARSSTPAWDTIPFPPADTVILGWRAAADHAARGPSGPG